MKFKGMGLVLLLGSLLTGFTGMAAAKEPPVAKLVQVEGEVEYSRNGTEWRPVRRTKYLFSGYRIKTGADGSGKLISQNDGMSQDLGSNSEIEITDEGATLISGNLTKPRQESGSIFEGLSNKFAKAQRYTTVRRSATGTANEKQCDNKVRTVKEVTLSAAYPDLVWRNACPEYSYRLVIDDNIIEIPAQATAEMIRYTVTDVKPGTHTYRVEVLDKDGTVYIPRKDSEFTWVDEKAEKALMAKLSSAADDVFIQASMLEEQGMHVAAMDVYREYFNENPDDNDMRPLLIERYNELKLQNLQLQEARLYNSSLEGDF
ncbi:MAG: hypothetical protein KDI36_07240 [Pseudomonadales bacterium]|nr:hypothetical protein [Pseudomonadales bacterium]